MTIRHRHQCASVAPPSVRLLNVPVKQLVNASPGSFCETTFRYKNALCYNINRKHMEVGLTRALLKPWVEGVFIPGITFLLYSFSVSTDVIPVPVFSVFNSKVGAVRFSLARIDARFCSKKTSQ